MCLENCFVGRFSETVNLQSSKESFFLGGFSFVRLRYLGKRLKKSLIKRSFEENKDWFDKIFQSFVPWNELFRGCQKICLG